MGLLSRHKVGYFQLGLLFGWSIYVPEQVKSDKIRYPSFKIVFHLNNLPLRPLKGVNLIYMAAWKNTQNITDWGYNTNTMLEQFWIDLINNNLGKIVYFHNWLSVGPYSNVLGYGMPFRSFSSSSFLLENIPNSIIPYDSPLPETIDFILNYPQSILLIS